MKLYKKVFLTLSGAGMLSGCCDNCSRPQRPPEKLYRVNAVVVQMDNPWNACYCDINGDGLIDRHIIYASGTTDRRVLLKSVLKIGDTIKFHTATPNYVHDELRWDCMNRDSINNQSMAQALDSIEYHNKIQKLRERAERDRQR